MVTEVTSLDGEIRDGRHHQQVRVYYEDTDFSGIVYYASYLHFMERGRTNYLRLIGADHRALFEQAEAEAPGLAFVVRREASLMRRRSRGLVAGLVCALLLLPCVTSQDFSAAAQSARRTPGPAAIAEYRKKLEQYEAARAAFEAVATPYWESVAEKRRTRFAKRRNKETIVLDDYVLTHPPVYSGPRRPVDPAAPSEDVAGRPPVPVAADFLTAAKEKFDFVPQRPDSELEYKSAYARVAAAAGLTIDQAVRVYGFETGGNGGYDVQAGVEYTRKGRAISTALGYNQLLTANSIDILSRKGAAWIKRLQAELPRRDGAARDALVARIAALERMTAAARSVPYRWSEHVKLGREPEGLGIHALNLDIDIGPLLQTQKLLDSVLFARAKGYSRPLAAAELEMMNLTGDGNGFDMVSMPEAMRDKVPTSNFFQRRGYELNSVVSRHNTVAMLLAATDARMDRAERRPGAKQLATAFCAKNAPDADRRGAC